MNAKRSRGTVMDQRLCGLAQDLVLHLQALDLAPQLAQFGTYVAAGGGQVTVMESTSMHE